jgi:hypothetical protein
MTHHFLGVRPFPGVAGGGNAGAARLCCRQRAKIVESRASREQRG